MYIYISYIYTHDMCMLYRIMAQDQYFQILLGMQMLLSREIRQAHLQKGHGQQQLHVRLRRLRETCQGVSKKRGEGLLESALGLIEGMLRAGFWKNYTAVSRHWGTYFGY